MKTASCPTLPSLKHAADLARHIRDGSTKRDENGIRVRPTVATMNLIVAIARKSDVAPAVLARIVLERFIEDFMEGRVSVDDLPKGRD